MPLVAGIKGEKLGHAGILRRRGPLFAEQVVDKHAGGFVGRVVRTDESAFTIAVILLGIMPKEEAHVLKVHLIVVIMIVRSVEGEVFAV